jgi:hypothetical protein
MLNAVDTRETREALHVEHLAGLVPLDEYLMYDAAMVTALALTEAPLGKVWTFGSAVTTGALLSGMQRTMDRLAMEAGVKS